MQLKRKQSSLRSTGRICFSVGLTFFYLSVWWCSGCITPRNFKSPSDRPIRGTPYTLAAKDVEIGLKIFGQDEDDLGAAIDLGVGITSRFQMGVNLAHGALGVLNVSAKLNLIDRKWWGLSGRTGILWVHPPSVWALSDETQSALGDIDIIAAPFELCLGSVPLKWLGLNFTLGYLHASIFGTINTETILFDGSIGARLLYLTPQINLFAFKILNIFLRATLPVLMYYRSELSAEVSVAPGVTAGVRSAEWVRRESPLNRSRGTVGLDVKLGKVTRLELFAVFQGALTQSGTIRMPVVPGMGAYWRF